MPAFNPGRGELVLADHFAARGHRATLRFVGLGSMRIRGRLSLGAGWVSTLAGLRPDRLLAIRSGP